MSLEPTNSCKDNTGRKHTGGISANANYLIFLRYRKSEKKTWVHGLKMGSDSFWLVPPGCLHIGYWMGHPELCNVLEWEMFGLYNLLKRSEWVGTSGVSVPLWFRALQSIEKRGPAQLLQTSSSLCYWQIFPSTGPLPCFSSSLQIRPGFCHDALSITLIYS